MNTAARRLLLEAGAVAANYRSATYRVASAREATKVRIEDLVCSTEAGMHVLAAAREAVIALGLVSEPAARCLLATAIRSLVETARSDKDANVRTSAKPEPRRYWIESDA
jgi:hypothetical protein